MSAPHVSVSFPPQQAAAPVQDSSEVKLMFYDAKSAPQPFSLPDPPAFPPPPPGRIPFPTPAYSPEHVDRATSGKCRCHGKSSAGRYSGHSSSYHHKKHCRHQTQDSSPSSGSSESSCSSSHSGLSSSSSLSRRRDRCHNNNSLAKRKGSRGLSMTSTAASAPPADDVLWLHFHHLLQVVSQIAL